VVAKVGFRRYDEERENGRQVKLDTNEAEPLTYKEDRSELKQGGKISCVG